MPSTKFVFFGPIRKTRWPPWPLIGWDIFAFSSETAERNSTKLDRKQDLNALYQVCVFWADRKNKMAALASDWLRHFRLLLWNRWTEFNETWQEASSQCLLPRLCFFRPIGKKQNGRPGLWLADFFFWLFLWNRWYFWFHSNISLAFIVLRWATVALWASCLTFSPKMGKTWNINLKHPILPLYGVFEQNITSIIKSWIGPKMALTEPSPLILNEWYSCNYHMYTQFRYPIDDILKWMF